MLSSECRDAIVVGLDSVLGSWVASVIRAACADAEPPVALMEAGRDHGVLAIGRTGGEPRVLMVRAPDRPVMDAIAEQRVPVLAVLDDPVDSVRYIRANGAADLLDALRRQTAAAAAHHLLRDNAAVLLVRRGMAGPSSAVIDAILAHVGVRIGEPARAALMATFCGPAEAAWSLERALSEHGECHAPLDQLGAAVSAEEADVVRQALSPLVSGAISAEIGTITWPARVFWYSDRPEEIPPRVVSLTGSARTIYYGPYFHLPPGLWQGQILVAFSDEARDVPFHLTVLCDSKVLTKVMLRPEHEGAFLGTFVLRHPTPEHRIEINFGNQEGMIEGHIALGQITFTRVSAEPR